MADVTFRGGNFSFCKHGQNMSEAFTCLLTTPAGDRGIVFSPPRFDEDTAINHDFAACSKGSKTMAQTQSFHPLQGRPKSVLDNRFLVEGDVVPDSGELALMANSLPRWHASRHTRWPRSYTIAHT